jgi:ABC-type polar amino acid transport system ATPase subunit
MIIGKKIYKNYGKKRVLNGVSVGINKGEITVITGPSGSGKTTLLRCLSLLDPPDKGEIQISEDKYLFEENRVNNKVIVSHFPKVGVVFQNLHLWPHLTNLKNITLALGKDITEDQNSYLNYLVDLLQLKECINRYPNESSEGQRQRVALVRTLILKPDYLLLDEITSSLDIEQVGIILRYLEKLKSEGVGILIVTHFLLFAQKAANHIVFLENGEVIEEGTNELLQKPKTVRLKQFLNGIENIIID